MAKENGKGKQRPKVTRIREAEPDVNQLAHHLIKMTTKAVNDEPSRAELSRVMAALGRRGGRIGGKSRAASMTAARRSEIAARAAAARWGATRRHDS